MKTVTIVANVVLCLGLCQCGRSTSFLILEDDSVLEELPGATDDSLDNEDDQRTYTSYASKPIQTATRDQPVDDDSFSIFSDTFTNSAEQEEQPRSEAMPEQPSLTPDDPFDKLTKIFDKVLSELKTQQDKVSELEKSNKKLQGKVDLIEQQMKTNNLVFFNVPESRHENHKITLHKVLHLLNKVLKIRTNADDIAVALRADGNTTTDRPILVKFTNFATKMRVVAAKSKVEGYGDVQIVADYSEQVLETRRRLLPFLSSARAQGRQAFLLYDKLVVDGVRKTLDELLKETEDVVDQPHCESTLDPDQPDEQVEEVEVPQETYI